MAGMDSGFGPLGSFQSFDLKGMSRVTTKRPTVGSVSEKDVDDEALRHLNKGQQLGQG